MSSISLTPSQQTLLRALIDRIRADEDRDAVSGERLAEAVDLAPGSVRNKMQHLKALQLVEGIPGPNGGYVPTGKAYRVLDLADVENARSVPVRCDGDRLTVATVTDVHLMSIHDADDCHAQVTVLGADRELPIGATLRIGPTPNSGLTIEGTIVDHEPDGTTLLVQIDAVDTVAD
jgi:predicted transcriptional regulator